MPDKSKTTLKACPFCGSDPRLIDARPNQSPPFYVLCKGKIGAHPCNAQMWPSDTPEHAIEVWNTRTA